MTPFNSWRVLVVVAALALPLLSACESDRNTTGAQPATAQPETVIAEEYVETEATIQAIDHKTRTVTLRTTDGRSQPVQAPADIDLKRLTKGNVVILGAYQKVSVRALPPGAAPLGVRQEAAMAKAKPGETPGRAYGQQTRATFEVASVDVANNRVTLKSADSTLRTLDVRNPDNQRKLKTLDVGDLVEIDITEAVVVGLKPKP